MYHSFNTLKRVERLNSVFVFRLALRGSRMSEFGRQPQMIFSSLTTGRVKNLRNLSVRLTPPTLNNKSSAMSQSS